MSKPLISIFLVFIISCSNREQKSDKASDSFNYPHVFQTSHYDSIEDWNTENINQVFPRFVGQYKFSDTVRLDDENQIRNIDEKQYMWEQRVYDFDTLSSDGLQIYSDYKTTVNAKPSYGATNTNRFFPVYIVNETSTPKLFIGKDSYAFAIQEAVDTSDFNSWYAIEAKGFDFCGNGYFRRKLLPKEFIMILMPKYSGTDTTYLRTRLKIGENILVSKPYKGVFNTKQFAISKDSWLIGEVKDASYKWMFYGGRNKE